MEERFKERIPPSLNTPLQERERLARNAGSNIHGAAIRVCVRLFGPEHNCATRLSTYRLRVDVKNSLTNAYIDHRNQITVFGGMIKRVGREDELAAVLAHEYSHGLMNHVRRKMRNVAGGSLIGMAVGAAVGAALEDPNSVGDGMASGARIGGSAGSLVFSEAMENEADHLGLFILNEAGYDPTAFSHLWMRLLNERRFTSNKDKKNTLMYFRTHPPHKERIQKLIAGEKMIQAGHLRPLWKR